MTPAREAITLPIVFLTVTLLGGLRIGNPTVLVPPSPYLLLLGGLLTRLVVKSGALAPERLLAASRSELANLNGLVVLITLWVAAAQALAVVTPESGIPHLAAGAFFLVLLLNTAAAAPDRQRLLRSLAVTFGAAFVLKFVILYGLSAPGDGVVKRGLQALVDAVTLGALMQEVPHPLTAYLALFAIGLFLVGVLLLPLRVASPRGALSRTRETIEIQHPSSNP
jgi:hypothetical protein